MDKKKELLFKYFTRFQGEELKFDNINDGYSPGGDSSKIMFDINNSILYFDTIWAETATVCGNAGVRAAPRPAAAGQSATRRPGAAVAGRRRQQVALTGNRAAADDGASAMSRRPRFPGAQNLLLLPDDPKLEIENGCLWRDLLPALRMRFPRHIQGAGGYRPI